MQPVGSSCSNGWCGGAAQRLLLTGAMLSGNKGLCKFFS